MDLYFTAVQYPVNGRSCTCSAEAVVSSGIGWRIERIAEWRAVGCVTIGKDRIAGTARYAIEIAGQQNRVVFTDLMDLPLNQQGAAALDGIVKIKMGCHAGQRPIVAIEPAQRALARPSAVGELALNLWRFTQIDMPVQAASPAPMKKDDIVLPSVRCRGPAADAIVTLEQPCQKIDLKIVCFLKCIEIA